ncbi:MAG: pantetheine-phosphate adenylyltransferase [Alphaproteobacteria bacterium]|jgi:pantetheine-phosphate adenylyltransferase
MKPFIAVYPGTFDPVTLGHIDVIKRAMHLCDRLIIGVAAHTGKNHLFNLQDRQAMLQSVINTEKWDNIEILPITNLTVDFVKNNNASLIIRGLRTLSDFDHEFQMVSTNKILNPEIETIFLPAALHSHCISSSVVRQIYAAGGDLSKFIHPSNVRYFN